MAATAAQKYKLKKFVKELENYRARGTELVSVYIPQGYELAKIIKHLQDEQGTASNIKSKSTRQNVIDALERMIRHLKLFNETPPNGFAVFSGNISEREGESNIQVWSIEPPVPMNMRLYRCDKTFILDTLKEMTENNVIYGLLVIDKREANIAILNGKTIIPIMEKHSMVPGKTRAGGQSAQR